MLMYFLVYRLIKLKDFRNRIEKDVWKQVFSKSILEGNLIIFVKLKMNLFLDFQECIYKCI